MGLKNLLKANLDDPSRVPRFESSSSNSRHVLKRQIAEPISIPFPTHLSTVLVLARALP